MRRAPNIVWGRDNSAKVFSEEENAEELKFLIFCPHFCEPSTKAKASLTAGLLPCYLSRSLAIGHQYSSLGTQPILCGSIPGLVPKQLRFCRNYVEIMPSVAEGVKIGIQECQHQFRGRRWNCTTVNDSLAIFGPVLDKGECSAMGLVTATAVVE